MVEQEARVRRLTRYRSASMTGEGLLDLDWVKALMAEPDCSPVITAGAMLSKESNLPADHMASVPLL